MYGHSRLDIRVSCRKKAGLLAEIINVLESLGLLFDDVNASCHNRLLLKASSTQVTLSYIYIYSGMSFFVYV